MSTFSKKQRTQLGQHHKPSAVSQFFNDIESNKKAHILSKKVSLPFMRKNETMRITNQNFKDVLASIASLTLSKNPEGLVLMSAINKYLKSECETSIKQNNELLIRISYKKDTISMEPLRTIEKEIRNEIIRSKNSIYIMIFRLWFGYMSSKFSSGSFTDKVQAKSNFHRDITIFVEFIANIIYQLFYDWFFMHENTINFYERLIKQFVPNFFTQHREWPQIYHGILKSFGEKPLKHITKAKPENVIFIDPEFSGEGLQTPWQTCIDKVGEIYDECIPRRKVGLLKELIEAVQRQVRVYQDIRIHQGKMTDYRPMDSDNLVGVYAYCILMSERDGVGESIEYLQLFFGDDKTDTKYLQELGIEHTLASIRSAAQYLTAEDNKLELL